MTLEELKKLCDERSSMAPFPWRFTRRFGWPRVECANGNVIVEPLNGDGLSGADEDLEFLALAASWLPKLIKVAEAAKDMREELLEARENDRQSIPAFDAALAALEADLCDRHGNQIIFPEQEDAAPEYLGVDEDDLA